MHTRTSTETRARADAQAWHFRIVPVCAWTSTMDGWTDGRPSRVRRYIKTHDDGRELLLRQVTAAPWGSPRCRRGMAPRPHGESPTSEPGPALSDSRHWAHPCHVCTGTGLTPAMSAPGTGVYQCARCGVQLVTLKKDKQRLTEEMASLANVTRPDVSERHPPTLARCAARSTHKGVRRTSCAPGDRMFRALGVILLLAAGASLHCGQSRRRNGVAALERDRVPRWSRCRRYAGDVGR